MLVVGIARVALRIAAHPLLDADEEINLAADAVIEDRGLPALLQLFDLIGGPLLAVVILLGDLLLF